MGFLDQVVKGKVPRPMFGVLYGVEGIGKTSFGSKMPNVIFAGPEYADAFDVAKLPVPKTFEEFVAQLIELRDGEHNFKSLCIDSLDHLENILIQDCMREQKKQSIKDCFGGYGGYVDGLNGIWMRMINLLSELRDKRKMNILCLAHYQIKKFDDPLTALPYERYKLKLIEKTADLFREKMDFVLFANFKNVSHSNDIKAKKGKALGGDIREVYTQRRASHDAKNRCGLPASIPFDYAEITGLLMASDVDKLKSIQADIVEDIAEIKDATLRATMTDYYEKNKNNYDTLVQAKNKIKLRLEAQGE